MFRYTRSKRGSMKIDWRTTGERLMHDSQYAHMKMHGRENKIQRIHIYACTDEQRFMFRFGS